MGSGHCRRGLVSIVPISCPLIAGGRRYRSAFATMMPGLLLACVAGWGQTPGAGHPTRKQDLTALSLEELSALSPYFSPMALGQWRQAASRSFRLRSRKSSVHLRNVYFAERASGASPVPGTLETRAFAHPEPMLCPPLGRGTHLQKWLRRAGRASSRVHHQIGVHAREDLAERIASRQRKTNAAHRHLDLGADFE
jgi:hypothetical protein